MASIGRLLILAGVVLVIAGGLLLLLGKAPGLNLGKLPGDLSWERGNTRVFAPFGTMLLVSVILTIVLNLLLRLFR